MIFLPYSITNNVRTQADLAKSRVIRQNSQTQPSNLSTPLLSLFPRFNQNTSTVTLPFNQNILVQRHTCFPSWFLLYCISEGSGGRRYCFFLSPFFCLTFPALLRPSLHIMFLSCLYFFLSKVPTIAYRIIAMLWH